MCLLLHVQLCETRATVRRFLIQTNTRTLSIMSNNNRVNASSLSVWRYLTPWMLWDWTTWSHRKKWKRPQPNSTLRGDGYHGHIANGKSILSGVHLTWRHPHDDATARASAGHNSSILDSEPLIKTGRNMLIWKPLNQWIIKKIAFHFGVWLRLISTFSFVFV